jgi:Flp pilus assembly protein TadD
MSIFEKLFGKADERPRAVSPVQDSHPTQLSTEKSADAAYRAGQKFAQSDQWGHAACEFQRATELEPHAPACHFALGRALFRLTPANLNDQQLEAYISRACAAYEKAMELGEQRGGLRTQDFREGAIACANFHRIGKRGDEALRFFRWGLKHVPEDPDLLSGLAQLLIHLGHGAEAERTAGKLLEQSPASPYWRKLWRLARRAQDKAFEVDRPEAQREEIFKAFHDVQETKLLTSEFAEDMKNAGDLGAMTKRLKQQGDVSTRAARDVVMNRYGLKSYELDFIIEEAEKKNWKYEGIPSRAAKAPPSAAAYRDSLTCQNCSKRNTTPFWPMQGNSVPFYFQSEATTRDTPGAFRLPVFCPFCKTTWYVVWDHSPDPLAGHFLHHLERFSEQLAAKPDALCQIRGQIHDRILGRYVQFIQENMEGCLASGDIKNDIFVFEDYHNVITLVPALDHDAVRRHLGRPYTMFLDTVATNWDKQKQHFAHWIFACDGQNANKHLCFLPRLSLGACLAGVMPVDLLTSQEKRAVNIG